MFPLIFGGFCEQKFGVYTLFLEIHPELKQFLRPKEGEDQKKAFNQKWSNFCVRKM